MPSHAHIQAATDGEREARLVYYAFDLLLHLEGRDVSGLPLIERKAPLEPLIANKPGIQFNGHDTGDGELILKHARKARIRRRRLQDDRCALCAPETAAYVAKAKALHRPVKTHHRRQAGQIRKDHALISGRCCWATTPTRASSFTPAVWARTMHVKVLPICGAAGPAGAQRRLSSEVGEHRVERRSPNNTSRPLVHDASGRRS